MKFCKRLLLATTAVSLTLFAGNNSSLFDPSSVGCWKCAGTAALSDRWSRKKSPHLHLSDPQLPEELVCEVIDEFTDRYSEQLAQWTHQGQSVQHQHGRHHSRSSSCQNACQRTDCPTCPNRTECRRIDCVTSHSCTVPQEYEAGWVAFSDAEDASTGQVKVLCRRCQAPGCNFLEKEWEVDPTK